MTSENLDTSFRVSFANQAAFLHIPPRLSALDAEDFKKAFQGILETQPSPEKVVLNFGQTTFIDSCGVGALVSNYNLAKQHGVSLSLTDVQTRIMMVLSMTGLEQILTIETSDQISQSAT